MPSAVRHNRPDRALLDTVGGGENLVRLPGALPSRSDFVGDLLGDLRPGTTTEVLPVRDGFQVGRVDARRLSTEVVDVQPFFDISVCPDVSLTVCESAVSNSRSVGEDPVAVDVLSEKVDPAGGVVAAVFFPPEMISPGNHLLHSGGVPLDESERIAFHPSEVCVVAGDEECPLPAPALTEVI